MRGIAAKHQLESLQIGVSYLSCNLSTALELRYCVTDLYISISFPGDWNHLHWIVYQYPQPLSRILENTQVGQDNTQTLD